MTRYRAIPDRYYGWTVQEEYEYPGLLPWTNARRWRYMARYETVDECKNFVNQLKSTSINLIIHLTQEPVDL